MPGTPNDIYTPASAPPTNDKLAEIALQDVIRYQEHLVKLIFLHDEKGHKVLSIYVTVLAAAVTASFALGQLGVLTLYLKIFLMGAAASLLVGCIWAYLAAWTAPIYLPGRKPDFWLWALEYENTITETVAAYLIESQAIIKFNEKLSDRSSSRLGHAYACGLAAAPIGAAAVWLTYWGT